MCHWKLIKPVYNSLKYCVIRELSKPKRWNAKGIFLFYIYTFLNSDFSTLIENRNNFQFWQDVCVNSWLFPFNNFMSWRRLCLFFFFFGTNIIIPYSFFVRKKVGWVGGHWSSLRKFFGRNHDLVDRYVISVSHMTTDIFHGHGTI